MVRATKPGGHVAIWVYGRENNGLLLSMLDPPRKLLFSRLPAPWVDALSIFPAAMLWVMLRIGLDQIAYFRLLQTFSFRHLRSIVFDQMVPKIANYWTRPEVDALMRGAGLVDVELFWVNEISWAARGRKPAPISQYARRAQRRTVRTIWECLGIGEAFVLGPVTVRYLAFRRIQNCYLDLPRILAGVSPRQPASISWRSAAKFVSNSKLSKCVSDRYGSDQLLYRHRGEPYPFTGRTLRYL